MSKFDDILAVARNGKLPAFSTRHGLVSRRELVFAACSSGSAEVATSHKPTSSRGLDVHGAPPNTHVRYGVKSDRVGRSA
jgi:hypothetical protein